MAYITVKYRSEALNRHVSFDMFIPNDDRTRCRPSGTLFILHGYSVSRWNWVPERLAVKHNIAVVIPDGENSFWLDGMSTGHRYGTFVGSELPDYIERTFGLADKPENTCILGFSMGGFGALHTALAYPERFGKTAAMSSALIVHEVAGMKPGDSNDHANYEYYRECFGEPSEVLGSSANPEYLIDRLIAEKKKIPEILMSCGTEDFLLENNREFHAFLDSKGVEHKYFESPGNHDLTFWNEYTERFIDMMFG